MTQPKAHIQLAAHEAAVKEAAAKLNAEIARMFPLGSIVETTIGRATIRGKVTGYSSRSMHDLGCIHIRNEKTGKYRRVYPGCESYNVRLVLPAQETAQKGR